MAGIGLYGLGSAAGGFVNGMNAAQTMDARQQQMEYQKTQQERQISQQKREDELRNDLKGVKSTEGYETANPNYVEPVLKDDEGNDMPAVAAQPKTITGTRDRPQDAVMRDYAAAYQKQGDIAKATEFTEKADKYAFQRSARQTQDLIASSSNASLYDMAKRAGDIFHNDPFGGGVRDVTQNADGTVTVKMLSKLDPDHASERTFKNKQDLAESLQAYYSPDTYAKLQETRMRISEEMSKNPYHNATPGSVVIDKRTGKPIYTNPTDRTVIGTDDSGNPIYGKMPGGSGAGAGAGAGSGKGKGAATDPTAAALSHFDTVVQHSEDKLPIDQASQARDYVGRLATTNPTMPPAMVSRVAIAAAKDPSKLVPAINPDTGLIDTVYDDGQNGKVTFNTGIGNAKNPGSLKPEQLQQMTATLLASKQPQEKAELIAAANDGKARGAIEARMRQQAADVIAQRTQGLTQEQAAVVTQQINDALQTKLGYLGNNLDMIAKYGEKPAPKKEAGGSKITQPGGMPKYAGLSGKALDTAVNADAQAQVDANRGRAQEVEKARKAAAADPELLKLDQERSALLRKGDGVGANSKIAEYNKLKKERYGL